MYLFSRLYHTPIQKPAIIVPVKDDILDMEWETLSIVEETQEEEHALLYDQESVSIPIEENTMIQDNDSVNQIQDTSLEKHNSTTEPYHYTSFALPPLTIPNENTDENTGEKQVQHVPNTSPYNDQPVFYATTLSWTPVACKKEDDIESDFFNLFTEMIDFLFGPDVIEKIKEHHAEKPISV